MDDAAGVGGRQRARDLAADLDDGLERRRPAAGLQRRPQRAPFDQLLDDVVIAAGGLADLVDDDDVRMIERGGGARLAEEAP